MTKLITAPTQLSQLDHGQIYNLDYGQFPSYLRYSLVSNMWEHWVVLPEAMCAQFESAYTEEEALEYFFS